MQLIDTHIHFDHPQFAPDRTQAYQRAQAANVVMQIVPALYATQWVQVQTVCHTFQQLFPAYGLHPMFLEQHQASHIAHLEQWLNQEQAVAVGECGLDFYLKHLDVPSQLEFFTAQLSIAKNMNLPVIIHARKSVDMVLKQLRHIPQLRGVIHSFVGSEQQARQLIDLGFYLGFGGAMTYARAQRLHKLVQVLPLESILLETDAPDQPLSTHRGERNEAAYLPEIVHTIATLRQQPPEQIALTTTCNAQRLFNLPSLN